MTRWARLTWQSSDPSALAVDLGQRLGVTVDRHGLHPGAFSIALGAADLELVPWQREAPADEPRSAGRLVFEPIEGGAADRVLLEQPPLLLVAVAWATVELERAEAELDAWLEGSPPDPDGTGVEPHLGARTRIRQAPGLPGGVLVLAEPTTEGRLAASLARDGEGPCALYVRPSDGLDAWLRAAGARRVTVSWPGSGPFGHEVLVPGHGVGGPHLLVVEERNPRATAGPPGTIDA